MSIAKAVSVNTYHFEQWRLLSLAAVVCIATAGMSWAGDHPEHPKANSKKALVSPKASSAALDGKTFSGELGESGAAKGKADDLVFENGQFVSTACVEYGFTSAAYKASEKGGVITFSAKATNLKGESMNWSGIVSEGSVKAKAVYLSGDKKTVHWYKGEIKAAGTTASKAAEHPKKAEHPK